MNRASGLDQGRKVTRPSERVTTGALPSASLTSPILAGPRRGTKETDFVPPSTRLPMRGGGHWRANGFRSTRSREYPVANLWTLVWNNGELRCAGMEHWKARLPRAAAHTEVSKASGDIVSRGRASR